MDYPTWQEALAALVKTESLENQELGAISRAASARSSARSNGTAGALGRLTRVSDILDLPPTDVFTTPGDGLNTYQGQCRDISSRSRRERGGEFTLTVFFDSKTSSRLAESLSIRDGKNASDGTAYSPIEVTLVLPTT